MRQIIFYTKFSGICIVLVFKSINIRDNVQLLSSFRCCSSQILVCDLMKVAQISKYFFFKIAGRDLIGAQNLLKKHNALVVSLRRSFLLVAKKLI